MHEPAPALPAGVAAPEPEGRVDRGAVPAGAEPGGHAACREAALAYARRGWKVLPLKPRGKEPLTEHGVHDATTDPAAIEAWWRRWPKANVGIATGAPSGLAVLDIDPRNGGDVALERLLAEHGGWGVPTDAGGHPETYTVLTGGGGAHYYFAADGPVPSRKLAPGVDLKGDGGYVVAPPSVHPSGRPYAVEASTERLPLALIPAWLLEAAGARRAPLYRELEGGPVREGQRNDCLASLAGRLRRRGLLQAGIEAELLAINAARCVPPLPDDEVRRIAESIARYPAEGPLDAAAAAPKTPIEYFADDRGTWRRRTRDGGPQDLEQLATFSARIRRELIIDDGELEQREFEIEAAVNGAAKSFTLSAAEFQKMDWPLERLGASAIVFPGPSVRDHLRAAIQQLSGDVPEVRVYAHLGWREIDGRQVFLHASGAVGAEGVLTRPPADLQRFALPNPPSPEELRRDIKEVLPRLLDVAPPRISWTLLAAAFLPTLFEPDFAVHLAGPSGVRKTELAALVQQFYGPGMNARNLPASWRSTANALETLAFLAKDCVLVVDDFVPVGSPQDVTQLYRHAEQLLRGAGNRAGRQRLTRDARLQNGRPPRCLILSTGEDIPPGHSLRARTWVGEVEPSDVDLGRLTELQRLAADGALARWMAGWLEWLAADWGAIRVMAKDLLEKRRSELAAGRHGRTASAQAALEVTVRFVLQFCVQAGALTQAQADELLKQAVAALEEGVATQASAQRESDPARRFLDLLRSALGSGKAHIADVSGKCPGKMPEVLGWRETEGGMSGEWRPQGVCIGWVDGEHIYLDPNSALQAAQQAAPASEPFVNTGRALGCALKQRGYLAAADESRGKNRVRKTIGGVRREVFVLPIGAILEDSREVEL
nr:bifunctional DNA primase/polymerase [Tepidiforma thermophila]